MKKCYLFLFVCTLVSALLISTALAHSGRTDSNGGHYNRSTGTYHYHHGYPAHQHPGGVCPYDYDDQTGKNSGNSITSSTSFDNYENEYLKEKQRAADNYELYQNTVEELNKVKENVRTLRWILIAVAFIFILNFLISKDKYTKMQKAKTLNENQFIKKISENTNQIEKLKIELAKTEDNLKKAKVIAAIKHDLHEVASQDELQSEYDRLRRELFDKYANKPPESFVTIPADTEIGKDGLPRQKGAVTNWGAKYTVYKAPSGKRYHRASCGRGTQPVHVYFVRGLASCGLCNPHIPDLTWYTEYRRIKSLKEKYGIP